MSEGNKNIIKYDIYRLFGVEGFEEADEVLILGLLQSLHFLVSIRADEVFYGNKLAKRRLSNSYCDKTVKLELVDFLKALLI